MEAPSRMPRYDVRNDGIGPYAVFYCERCEREYRSKPNVVSTIKKDIGREAARGFLSNIPFGGAVADRVVGEDPRYVYSLTQEQLDAAWKEVQINFRECPTCQLVVCMSDFDVKSGYCMEDSPRREEIAQAQAEQGIGTLKGIANAFGFGDVLKTAAVAAQTASAQAARCPKDGTMAAAGTKFCPECGSPMVQPTADPCPKCGADSKGAKFCPECGTKIERAAVATNCSKCGAELKGAKFCPECGAKAEAAPPPPTKCSNCGAELKGAKFCAECGTKAG